MISISIKSLRINGAIRVPNVRLIDEQNNQVGIVPTNQAIGMAMDVGLDLVEVAPTNDPPVCRIMDYGKWLYEQQIKEKESRKKSAHAATLKEIRLRPETGKHDLDVKLSHAREFLQKGHRVQFTLMFRGRQMLRQEKGDDVLSEIYNSLQDISKIDQTGKMANRRMTMVLVPSVQPK